MTANPWIFGTSSDEYLRAMEGAIARALREGVASLRDPRVACPHDALRSLDSVVEMLAGFTFGSLVRNLHTGVVRWFDESVARQFLRTDFRLERLHADVTYLADARERPLVNELASRLHLRYCAMSRALEATTREIERLVQQGAPNQHRLLPRLYGFLYNDADDLAEGFADEIRFAWSMFSAAAAGKSLPTVAGRNARSAAMWSIWLDRARPTAAAPTSGPPTPERDDAQDAGYILLVA